MIETGCVITQWKWIELLTRQLDICRLTGEECAVIVSDAATNPDLLESSIAATQRLSRRVTQITVLDSTNERTLENPATRAALKAADFVLDLTGAGLEHDHRLSLVLDNNTRILVIGSRPMTELERQVPHPGLGRRAERALAGLHSAQSLLITRSEGTSLRIDVSEARVDAHWGAATDPGQLARWPSGRVSIVPGDGTVEGTIVLMPGDLNLTLRAYVRSPVRLDIRNDHICDIEGDSGDSDLIRTYLESEPGTDTYGLASVGWGMNQTTRASEPSLYDRALLTTGEAATHAGNLVISTGSNDVAGRNSSIRLDLCMRGCTVAVDEVEWIHDGQLLGELAPDVYERSARE